VTVGRAATAGSRVRVMRGSGGGGGAGADMELHAVNGGGSGSGSVSPGSTVATVLSGLKTAADLRSTVV